MYNSLMQYPRPLAFEEAALFTTVAALVLFVFLLFLTHWRPPGATRTDNRPSGVSRRGLVRRVSALFGGVAAGGSLAAQEPPASGTGRAFAGILISQPPTSGQCPVCGAMAPPWKRPLAPGPCRAVLNSNHMECVPGEPYSPTEVMTGCARCRVVFMHKSDN